MIISLSVLVGGSSRTAGCETEEKEMFYAKLDSVLDQCPRRNALIVLGDFNVVTGTERAGYEICVGPHGSGQVWQRYSPQYFPVSPPR